MTSSGQAGRLPLTRDRILTVAVQIVDEHGVEGLTMRRLGAELGVEAMSIYNHLPNKAALLDGVVETVIGEIDLPPQEEDWTERLKRLGRSYRAMALRHPRCVPLLAMRPFSATPALEPVEIVFQALMEAGLDPAGSVDAYRTMASFALGYSMTEAAGAAGGGAEMSPELQEQGAALLEGYPSLAQAFPHLAGADPAAQFEYGLDVLIEGITTKLPQR